ncbi:xylose isomerase [Loigolactobacillus backii]|uniref:Xylose isomerase n=1 Tax=Loigolactobacillus backii TaxID=375175 RepID=A0A192H196_9LACO|nr:MULTISPECIES: TIM barrel protein [Loigolactobacillus]ANK62579.1 xylose isomerase [Loigolactobacillus backii]ANK70411.1 xylose isomerase [Loigolactobacillus backii]
MTVQLGLKASTAASQINDRLQYRPEVFEFFLQASDFTLEGLKQLAAAIDQVKAVTGKIVLHQPMRYQGNYTELIAPEEQMPELYRFIQTSTEAMLAIATQKRVQVLLHGSYFRQTPHFIAMYDDFAAAEKAMFGRLDYFAKIGGERIMFENSISPLYFYGDPAMDDKIYAKNYRLAFDTSHCFIKAHGDNAVLMAALDRLHDHIVHYHIVDSMGLTHDSLQVGKGAINWAQVLPRLNPRATNIYEINLADPNDAKEQVASHAYLTALEKSSK